MARALSSNTVAIGRVIKQANVRVKATTSVFQLDYTKEEAGHGYTHKPKPCRLPSDVQDATFATQMNALILHAVHF